MHNSINDQCKLFVTLYFTACNQFEHHTTFPNFDNSLFLLFLYNHYYCHLVILNHSWSTQVKNDRRYAPTKGNQEKTDRKRENPQYPLIHLNANYVLQVSLKNFKSQTILCHFQNECHYQTYFKPQAF